MSCAFLVVVIGLIVASNASAHEPARLTLSADGWHIVEPYRYDEARRFDSGWNRGVDALPTRGVVRTATDGIVRFTGIVAGRRVVTVATSIDGTDVVVTYTGLSDLDVRRGERVAVGRRLGSGTLVHVGAYDAVRRSRYLPVVVANSRGVAVRDDGLAGVVASRLEQAINGTARPAGVDVAAPMVSRGPVVRDAGGSPASAGGTGHGATAASALLERVVRAPGRSHPVTQDTVALSHAERSVLLDAAVNGGTALPRSWPVGDDDAAASRTARTSTTEVRAVAATSPEGTTPGPWWHRAELVTTRMVSAGQARTESTSRQTGRQRPVADAARRSRASVVAASDGTTRRGDAVSGSRRIGGSPRSSPDRSAGEAVTPQAPERGGSVHEIGDSNAADTATGDQADVDGRGVLFVLVPLGVLAIMTLLARRRAARRQPDEEVRVHRIPAPVVPSPRRHGRVIPTMPPEEQCEPHVPIVGGVGLVDIDQPHEHPVRRRPREPA